MGIQFDCAGKTPLTEGGEGIIYEWNHKIFKIYKPVVDLKSKQKKVQMLMKKSLPEEVVVPRDIVTDKKGKFTGYMMDKVEGDEFKRLSNKKFVTANAITTKDILFMLARAWYVITQLHKNNIFIGDLNDQNLLFDRQFHLFFIDCDSWTIEEERCTVAVDLFKDPLLQSNAFNRETDTYAFAVLAWKSLTRLHPFGGTMKPDMDIMERMKKGISVIENPDVTIPRTVKPWKNLSPGLVSCMKRIFESGLREMGSELDDMLQNLKYCEKDKEYYYGAFFTCPLCSAGAVIQAKPVSQGVMDGVGLFPVLDGQKIKTVINENCYLDTDGWIIDIRSGAKVKYEYGTQYFFTSDGYVVFDMPDRFVIHAKRQYVIEKKYKSRIVVEKNHIYYISRQNTFVEMTVLEQGNSINNICKCSSQSYFGAYKERFCIVNRYPGKLILDADGRNIEIAYDKDMINYGIHLDEATGRWLVVLEDTRGAFTTYIVKDGEIEYAADSIKYSCQPDCLCIFNASVFIPMDGKIRGFSYKKNVFKDFVCGVVNENSKLIRKKNKFVIVNDENKYHFG